MLFHQPDRTFKRIAQAVKRIKHFARDNKAVYNENHLLTIAFANMKLAWPERDYGEQLTLLDWFCERVNNFCDNNHIKDDIIAQDVFYEVLSGDYIWCDFEILAGMVKK